jgi:hypothetical protein
VMRDDGAITTERNVGVPSRYRGVGPSSPPPQPPPSVGRPQRAAKTAAVLSMKQQLVTGITHKDKGNSALGGCIFTW